jgi:hypothetical protein
MVLPDPARASRRRRGLLLGGVGLVLLFVPAVSTIFLPPNLAPMAVVLMVAGIVLLFAGFVTLPRKI